jgi:hypothetical protein
VRKRGSEVEVEVEMEVEMGIGWKGLGPSLHEWVMRGGN